MGIITLEYFKKVKQTDMEFFILQIINNYNLVYGERTNLLKNEKSQYL
jgi:hypothetical protein